MVVMRLVEVLQRVMRCSSFMVGVELVGWGCVCWVFRRG